MRRTFRGLSALRRARDRVVVHLVVLDLAEGLGARADELQAAAVEVEHVRARVDLAEGAVRVERVELGGALEALRRHGLDDVAGDDVLLEGGHEALVALLADVGHGVCAEGDRGLRHLRGGGLEDDAGEPAGLGDGGLVGEGEVGGADVVGAEDVGDDLDVLEEVVVDEDGVDEHENGLGDVEVVVERAGGLGLEVLDGVVGDVGDGAAGEGGDLGELDVAVDGELALEGEHGVAGDLLVGAGLDYLEGI